VPGQRQILIDAPNAGNWIMERVGGWVVPAVDHSFATYHGAQILGGFVVCEFLGNSMRAHMAAEDPRWFSRELAWLVCDYVFNQIGCGKMVTGVRSDNFAVLFMCRRAGWQVETSVADLYEPGVDMVILAMYPGSCSWLNYRPKLFRSKIRTLLQE
jgi:hypothetical protein